MDSTYKSAQYFSTVDHFTRVYDFYDWLSSSSLIQTFKLIILIILLGKSINQIIKHIIEIENLVKSRLNWNIIIPDYATYRTTKFKVISISDMVDDSKHDRIKCIKEYKVDKTTARRN